MQAAGSVRFGSLEVTEVRFPLFFRHHKFRPDSFGDGKFRGGAGSSLQIEMNITSPAIANMAGDGLRNAPYGLFGGKPGKTHSYRKLSGDQVRYLKTKESGVAVLPGDVLDIQSSGGGGWGDPAARSPAATAADLADGLL